MSTNESQIDILTPAYLDQTMEEFLRLSIQRKQRELDCVAADKWAPVDTQEKRAIDYNLPTDWMVGLRRGDVVIERAIPPDISDRIWRKSESRIFRSWSIRSQNQRISEINSGDNQK